MKKAVVLLSGGLDSSTTLAIAKDQGFQCHALTVDYGQRHRAELNAAKRIARALQAFEHHIFPLELTVFGGSALTDKNIDVPLAASTGIPPTYVPARNTIMLSLALAWAETLSSNDIFIGANAVDYSGYPDCRPEYIAAYQSMANLATKAAVGGRALSIHAPLIALSKAEIIRSGAALGVDFALTISCYLASDDGLACGQCDSCRLRLAGFAAAGLPDPARYRQAS